ncbi:zinc finger protein [Schaalia cardiffensis F0333]|uniref:Zinc finger protein n=1 Tax=Schaalia cardiffensis F0333 TaxID=888050 RepID=N6X147_9ACTO|nr:zinc finger protein [Schaalia cardiffensis F0333]
MGVGTGFLSGHWERDLLASSDSSMVFAVAFSCLTWPKGDSRFVACEEDSQIASV